MSNFMNNLDLHLEEEYYNGIDTIQEDMLLNKFDKDKYVRIISNYQDTLYEIIETQNDLEGITEEEMVYSDINEYFDNKFKDWEEDTFIDYIEYLKKLVGEDK